MKPVIRRKTTRANYYLSKGKTLASKVTDSQTSKKLLLHQVFFWLKNAESIEDREQLIAGIKTLSSIDVVHKLHVGILASTEKRAVVDTSWQVSELMFFEDTDAQKIYQDHPLHHAFIDNCSHLWSKVLVYDSLEQ